MKLPDPSWLNLEEAMRLILDFLGLDHELFYLYENRLYRAFKYGELSARGRSKRYFRNESINLIPIAAWESADGVDTESSSFLYQNDILDVEFTEIEVSREELIKWLSSSETPEITIAPTSDPSVAEEPGYRSPFMKLMLAAEAHFGMRLTLSEGIAKKEEIEKWLRRHWQEFISQELTENKIAEMASLIRHPDLGKGGNRRFK